jgi:hypothetical protein
MGFYSTDQLHDDIMGGRAVRKMESYTNMTFNLSFFYEHSIRNRTFSKASPKQLSITDFLGGGVCNLHTGINIPFHLFIIFVGLSGKFIIFIFFMSSNTF